jgi:hypothetical protein
MQAVALDVCSSTQLSQAAVDTPMTAVLGAVGLGCVIGIFLRLLLSKKPWLVVEVNITQEVPMQTRRPAFCVGTAPVNFFDMPGNFFFKPKGENVEPIHQPLRERIAKDPNRQNPAEKLNERSSTSDDDDESLESWCDTEDK